MNKDHLLHRRRHIVVGDIHGCFDEFQELLDKAEYKQDKDHLILVGDLVDRGPKSRAVVDWAMKNDSDISVIQGNHEAKHLRYFRHEQKKLHNRHYKNPMKMPEYILEAYESLDDSHRWYLKKLPFYVRLQEFSMVVVHGGLLPGKRVQDHAPEEIIYTRFLDNETHAQAQLGGPPDFKPREGSSFWTKFWDGAEHVAFGHHVLDLHDVLELETAHDQATCYALDTGCCFGGRLSAMVLERGHVEPTKYVQVDAKKVYFAHSND